MDNCKFLELITKPGKTPKENEIKFNDVLTSVLMGEDEILKREYDYVTNNQKLLAKVLKSGTIKTAIKQLDMELENRGFKK